MKFIQSIQIIYEAFKNQILKIKVLLFYSMPHNTYRIAEVNRDSFDNISEIKVQLAGTGRILTYSLKGLLNEKEICYELSTRDYSFLLDEYYKMENCNEFCLISQYFDHEGNVQYKFRCMNENIDFMLNDEQLLKMDTVISKIHSRQAYRLGYMSALHQARKTELRKSTFNTVVPLRNDLLDIKIEVNDG